MAGKPRLLDLFCGAGGCSVGYERAGFDVVGVDLNPQPRYPFPFRQADAMEVLAGLVDAGCDFDAIHASPPCQDYSKAMAHLSGGDFPRLVEPTREALQAIGLPWVIENVVGAPLPIQSDLFGAHGVELCGTMFDLRVYRHRLFECSFPVEPPRPCNHSRHAMNPHQSDGRDRMDAEFGEGHNREEVWRAAMGVEWMNMQEGREAIPPAYTEHIGHYLMLEVRSRLLDPPVTGEGE